MNNCTRCGGRLAKDATGPTHDDCQSQRKPGGRRVVVAFSLSPAHVAKLDALRGDVGRSDWLRGVLDRI